MTFQKVVKAFYHLGLSEKEIAKLFVPDLDIVEKVSTVIQSDNFTNDLLDRFVISRQFNKEEADKKFVELLNSINLDNIEYIDYDMEELYAWKLTHEKSIEVARYVLRGCLSEIGNKATKYVIMSEIVTKFDELEKLKLIEYIRKLLTNNDNNISKTGLLQLGKCLTTFLNSNDDDKEKLFFDITSLRYNMKKEFVPVFLGGVFTCDIVNISLLSILSVIIKCVVEGFGLPNNSDDIISRRIKHASSHDFVMEELIESHNMLRDVLGFISLARKQ